MAVRKTGQSVFLLEISIPSTKGGRSDPTEEQLEPKAMKERGLEEQGSEPCGHHVLADQVLIPAQKSSLTEEGLQTPQPVFESEKQLSGSEKPFMMHEDPLQPHSSPLNAKDEAKDRI